MGDFDEVLKSLESIDHETSRKEREEGKRNWLN